MQEVREYFTIQEEEVTKGECTQLISKSQKNWRVVDKLEQYPFQRVSVYTRNVEYTSANVRTPDTLKRALNYLCRSIFPLVFEEDRSEDDRQHAILFLEERLIAIRCQYFVQGVINPSQLLKLLKCMIVVDIMRGFSSGNRPLVGLELLVEPSSKTIMENSFPSQYRQSLKLSILSSKKKDIQQLLLNHPIILQDEELYHFLQLKIKIESNNFEAYYQAFQTEEPLVQCLLWLQIDSLKATVKSIVKKSYGDVPTKWILKLLCLKRDGNQGWISLKKNPQLPQQSSGYQTWLKKQTLQKMINL